MPQHSGAAPKQTRPSTSSSGKSTPTPREYGTPTAKKVSKPEPQPETLADSLLPELHATRLLKALHKAFLPIFSMSSYHSTLRQIKRYFAERDYGKIFGPGDEERERLAVYAADYIGGRAVGYCCLWGQEEGIVNALERAVSAGRSNGGQKRTRIACLGAGTGAEAMAVAGLLARILESQRTEETGDVAPGLGKLDISEATADSSLAPEKPISVTSIDYADYSSVFQPVADAIAGSFPDVADICTFSFEKLDLISVKDAPRLDAILAESDIITLNFTLNEILAQSKSDTAAFLHRLTAKTRPGTIFASIDSAGSFSDLALPSAATGQEKVYPAPMLLSLLSRGPFWEELSSKDSVWWRLAKEEREEVEAWYPARVEDFRCFIRVLRKR